MVDHALAVDEKIGRINEAWPRVVSTYEARVRAELASKQVALRRYEAAVRATVTDSNRQLRRYEAAVRRRATRAALSTPCAFH